MAFGTLLEKKDRISIKQVVKEVLDINIKTKSEFEIVYDTIIAVYSEEIRKEFDKLNIPLIALFEKNYTVNVVLNYGLLKNDIPASLVDFKSFKKAKLLEHKKKILSRLVNAKNENIVEN